MDNSDAAFKAAVKHAASPACSKASTEQKSKLYGHYKQALFGDVNIQRPGMFDPVGRTKWVAWAAVKGTSASVARSSYIDVVRQIDPTFSPSPPYPLTPTPSATSPGSPRRRPRNTPKLRPRARPPRKSGSLAMVRYTNGHSVDPRREAFGAAGSGLRDLSASFDAARTRGDAMSPSPQGAGASWRPLVAVATWPRQMWSALGSMDAWLWAAASQFGGWFLAAALLLSFIGAVSQEHWATAIAAAGVGVVMALTNGNIGRLKSRGAKAESEEMSLGGGAGERWKVLEWWAGRAKSIGGVPFLLLKHAGRFLGNLSSWSLSGGKTSDAEVEDDTPFPPLKKRRSSRFREGTHGAVGSGVGGGGSGGSSSSGGGGSDGGSDGASGKVEVLNAVLDPRGALDEFRGTWEKDMSRSTSQAAHLESLGVPWIVRSAIVRSNQTTHISTTGVTWTESTQNWGGRNVQTLQLDNTTQQRRNPLDKSPVTMISALRTDGCVVTESEYPEKGIKQTLTRAVEWSGDRDKSLVGDIYHVTNTMVLSDGRQLVCHSYFNRVEEPGDPDTEEDDGTFNASQGAKADKDIEDFHDYPDERGIGSAADRNTGGNSSPTKRSASSARNAGSADRRELGGNPVGSESDTSSGGSFAAANTKKATKHFGARSV